MKGAGRSDQKIAAQCVAGRFPYGDQSELDFGECDAPKIRWNGLLIKNEQRLRHWPDFAEYEATNNRQSGQLNKNKNRHNGQLNENNQRLR